MSWQDDLRQLDSELSEGKISIEEHRKRRDDLLATASSTATVQPPPAPPTTAFEAPPQAAQPEPNQAAAHPQAAPQAPAQPDPAEPALAQPTPSASMPFTPPAEPASAGGGWAPVEPPAEQAPAPQQEAAQFESTQPESTQQEIAQPEAAEPAGSWVPVEEPAQVQQPADQPAAEHQQQAAPVQQHPGHHLDQHPESPAEVTQQVARPSEAETTSVLRGGPAAPPESPAEQTQWVARNPAQPAPQAFGSPERTQSIAPERTQSLMPERTQSINPNNPNNAGPYSAESAAERTQQVPRVPGGYQSGGAPYSSLASGLQQQRSGGGGPRPGANAGEAWQPNWHREWEPAPGGAPFDPFGRPPQDPGDSFAADSDKKSPLTDKRVLIPVAALLVVVLVALGLWFFVFNDNGNDQAGGGGGEHKVQALPTDLNGMINALPKLPGVPNAKIGPTIPAAVAATQGLYPATTADKLSDGGHSDVVYKASSDGSQQYGVLAVLSDDPKGIRADILSQQRSDGWQEASQPNMPAGSTGLERTRGGITFHRVLYTAGKWTMFIGVSPTNSGNDARITQEFGDLVKAVSAAVPTA